MTIELTKDRALVLVGAQGSGKTRLAEKIAQKIGAPAFIDAPVTYQKLLRLFYLSEPAVVVIDDCNSNNERAIIKELIAGVLRIENRGLRESKTIHPYVIITTNDERWLKGDDRRCHVLPIAEARRLMGEPS